MLALLGLLPQIFGLGGQIVDLFKMKEKAKSDKELKEIDKEIEAVRDKRAVLVAEAGSSINAAIRAALSLSLVLVLIKIWAWDHVAGSIAGCVKQYSELPGCEYFYTAPFSDWDKGAMTAMICFYFLAEKFGAPKR